MDIFFGIFCLLFMCGSILFFSSFSISLQTKKHQPKKKFPQKTKDFYSYLFDVYEEK